MKIYVNDNIGFVELITHTPIDPFLQTVNAARVSYAKVSEELQDRDIRLVEYLAEHEHTSPFRHWFCSFRIKAPRAIAMQMWKHIVGSQYTFNDTGWNEMSQRYVQVPEEWLGISSFREQHKVNKQTSAQDLLPDSQVACTDVYEKATAAAYDAYQELLRLGVCREQARMVLPLATYTEWVWSPSLQALAHMVRLRTHEGAQLEVREYAKAMDAIFTGLFERSLTTITK